MYPRTRVVKLSWSGEKIDENIAKILIRWKYGRNNHLPDFRPFAHPPRWMWWKRWWRRWARAAEQVSTGQDYHNYIISWWYHNILIKGLGEIGISKKYHKKFNFNFQNNYINLQNILARPYRPRWWHPKRFIKQLEHFEHFLQKYVIQHAKYNGNTATLDQQGSTSPDDDIWMYSYSCQSVWTKLDLFKMIDIDKKCWHH